MRTIFALLVLVVLSAAASAAGSAQASETLVTPNYSVVVTRNCPKAALTCTKVNAKVKTKDGREYRLGRGAIYAHAATAGSASTAVGPAGGYRFTHKNTEYIVLDSGDLTITRRGKVIAKEQGSWSRQG